MKIKIERMKNEIDNNQHIIFIGFGKCGTTLIDYALRKTQEFLMPTNIKEIGYFRSHNFTGNLEDYLKHYPVDKKSKETKKKLVECCPPYLHEKNLNVIFENIKKVGLDCKFVVSVRNPIYRSYSHYTHNISGHYAYNGFTFNRGIKNFAHGKIYKYSFYEAIEIQRNLCQPSYYNQVKHLIEEFGQDKVFFFIMEQDIKKFDNFYQRFCEFCGVDYKPYFKNQTMPVILGGTSLPRYYYADDKDLIIECNQTLFKLPKGDLLLSQIKKSKIFKGMPPKLALSVTASPNFWTKKLTKEMCLKIYQKYFEQDMSNFLKLIHDYYGSTYDISFYQDYMFKDKLVDFSQLDYEFLKSNLEIVG